MIPSREQRGLDVFVLLTWMEDDVLVLRYFQREKERKRRRKKVLGAMEGATVMAYIIGLGGLRFLQFWVGMGGGPQETGT
jgi:hypothetical protein